MKNKMTKLESAIYAALPIFENAFHGDLDKEIALKWIQKLLLEGIAKEFLTNT